MLVLMSALVSEAVLSPPTQAGKGPQIERWTVTSLRARIGYETPVLDTVVSSRSKHLLQSLLFLYIVAAPACSREKLLDVLVVHG